MKRASSLELTGTLRLFSWLVLMPLALGVFLAGPKGQPVPAWLPWVCFGALGALAAANLVACIAVVPVAVTAAEDGLRVRLLGRGWRSLPWTAVKEVEPQFRWWWPILTFPPAGIALKLESGRRIHLIPFLTGLPDLVRAVRCHIGSPVSAP